MSMTRGHLPLLIICLSLNSVLPAYAQSEGELASAPVLQLEQVVLIALEHRPTDTCNTPGRTTSMLAGRRSTAGSVATNIINRTDTQVPENPRERLNHEYKEQLKTFDKQEK